MSGASLWPRSSTAASSSLRLPDSVLGSNGAEGTPRERDALLWLAGQHRQVHLHFAKYLVSRCECPRTLDPMGHALLLVTASWAVRGYRRIQLVGRVPEMGVFTSSQAVHVHLVLARCQGSLLGSRHLGVGQADVLILLSAWGIIDLVIDVGQDTRLRGWSPGPRDGAPCLLPCCPEFRSVPAQTG